MIILYKFITRVKYWRYMRNNNSVHLKSSRIDTSSRARRSRTMTSRRRNEQLKRENEGRKGLQRMAEGCGRMEEGRKEGPLGCISPPSTHPFLLRRPLASSWPSSPGRFSTAPKRRGQWDAGRRYWSEASSRRRPLQDARLARRERAAPQFEIKGRKPLLETSRGSFRLPCVLYVRVKPRIWSGVVRSPLSPWPRYTLRRTSCRRHESFVDGNPGVAAESADRKVCRSFSSLGTRQYFLFLLFRTN